MICRVRTITASCTSPFFTVPSGAASLMCDLDDVADAGVTLVAAEHADGPGDLGAGVVRHIQMGTNL